jgi:hypothetical protein
LRRRNKVAGAQDEGSDSDSDEGAPSVTDSLMEEDASGPSEVKDAVTGQKGSAQPSTSVAEDVIQRKGVYGRFADKWFSRKGWSADSRRLQGLSPDEDASKKNVPQNVDSSVAKEAEQPEGASKPDTIPSDDKNVPEPVSPGEIPKALAGEKDATTVALLPKILQTTRMYFSSGNFFFSYDYDISHGIGQQQPNSSLPLHKQFDPLVSRRFCPLSRIANGKLVLLEPAHNYPVRRRRSACLRSSCPPGLCWTEAFYPQGGGFGVW